MFASLRYIQTHHAYGQIEGQPDQDPYASQTTAADRAEDLPNGSVNTQTPGLISVNRATTADAQDAVPDSPADFQVALKELARDLILKEQQIEYLIGVLPGIGTSERDQSARIQTLEGELREAEKERQAAALQKDEMLGLLGQLAAKCKRVY